MSANTLQRRLNNVLVAIEGRVWLKGQYASEASQQPVYRAILPFRVYRSRHGELVMDGFDTYRQAVRTFRLDRFTRLAKGAPHAGDDPAVLPTRHGQVAVYPVAWSLVQARPQTISEKALDAFLARGWAVAPYAGVVEPPQAQ